MKLKLRNLELQHARVSLDFQDARDNELAAERALLLRSQRESPRESPRESSDRTPDSKVRDDMRRTNDHNSSITSITRSKSRDLDRSMTVVLEELSISAADDVNLSSDESSDGGVELKLRGDDSDDNTESSRDESKRLSVEDGPEGEDVMENWNKATLKVS